MLRPEPRESCNGRHDIHQGGSLVGLGSANQRRLKVILRARGGDLEGEGGREKREKGELKKKRVQQQLKMRQRVHCKNWHQHTSTVREAAQVVVNGAKPKKRAISESNE
ncbi:hypothetical protein HDV62DRAFT_100607 [Trichoderma sp. SZMC 28011]